MKNQIICILFLFSVLNAQTEKTDSKYMFKKDIHSLVLRRDEYTTDKIPKPKINCYEFINSTHSKKCHSIR